VNHSPQTNVVSISRPAARLRESPSPEAFTAMTEELRRLRSEKFTTAAHLNLQGVVLEWFIRDADRLVFDVDERSFTLWSAFQDPRFSAAAAKAIAGALQGGPLPRALCSSCRAVGCRTGCGGANVIARVPAKIADLLREARNA
jgi:hypothetical protein